MYISLHSFGELILYPWSHTKKPVHDWRELDEMARRWSDVVFRSSKGKYKYRVGDGNLNSNTCLKIHCITRKIINCSNIYSSRLDQRMITFCIMHMAPLWIGREEMRESSGHILLNYLHLILRQKLLVDSYSPQKQLYRLPAVYLMASLMLRYPFTITFDCGRC